MPVPGMEGLREAIQKEVESLDARLVDLTLRKGRGRNVLTVLADKEGGITLGDCAAINNHLSGFLDRMARAEAGAEALGFGIFDAPCDLEVNSPGLDRPLETPEDFLRVAGKLVRVVMKPEAGAGVYRGKLLSVKEGMVELKGKEAAPVYLPIRSILKGIQEISF
ncbi:MAG: hypothetical protein HY593_01235 [Candidatus Omnitrophica bacterium]|nr:hypothetical protein [Candidatus Omnitrophota bacterium]